MEAEKKRGWWKKKKWCMTEDKCSEARNRIFMKTHYAIDRKTILKREAR